MSLLVDIGTRLSSLFGVTLGTDLYLGQLPERTDTCIVVYERPGAVHFNMGAEDGAEHTPSLEQPRIQVLVRRANSPTAYPEGSDLIYEITRRLPTVNVTINGTRYIAIEAMGTAGPLDEDKEGRISFVSNFMVTREPEVLA